MVGSPYDDECLALVCDAIDVLAADDRFYAKLAGQDAAVVLDVGTGTGRLATLMASRGHMVTAVEPSAQMLSVARARAGAG